MDREQVTRTLPWMRQGTELLLRTVAGIGDEELHAPSALPGWTRAHVVAHLARNAEALGRLAHWASTGEATPMYPDLEARNADIERTARAPVAALRSELAATAADLDERLSVMTDEAWSAQVRTAQGRPIAAREVPWMRNREVWLHAVDFGTGVRTTAFPRDLVELLLDDVAGAVGAKPDCPALVLRATDADRAWPLGPDRERGEVSGPAAELLAWVSGRPTTGLVAAGSALPVLPPWI